MELINKVTEVKETSSIDEVNQLIKSGWILLHIVPNKEPVYSLGRLDSDNSSNS